MRESYAAWLGLVARLVTGGVWLVAGFLKLPDPAESVRAVRAYDLLPESAVATVGHLSRWSRSSSASVWSPAW